MADRPIIFAAPMVRAMLDGRKTMTRRILKPQPDPRTTDISICRDKWMGCGPASTGHGTAQWDSWRTLRWCAGDRLWVRESFVPRYFDDGRCGYRADWTVGAADFCKEPRWKPSIHMPRWASRLTLTVTAAKIERLQEITEEDAIAEGISYSDDYEGYHTEDCRCYHASRPDESFAHLWESLHGPGSWAANPAVVAVSFTIRQSNINAC